MITITNNNIYYSEEPISYLSSIEDAEVIDPNNILLFLSDTVELGENLIFKRLFDIISHNVNDFNDIFYSSLDGYYIDPFLQEIENNPTDKLDMDYLEVSWSCNKYDNELNVTPTIHGVSDNDSEFYAIDFVSLNNIKKLNISLNKNFTVYDYNKLIEGKNEDESKTDLGEKTFTLFELYNAIFSEITFHGGPLDKKERFEELEKCIEEEDINPEEYKILKKSTLDELIDKYEKEDKYLVKYKDLRSRVDENRIKNNENLSKLKDCLKNKLEIYDAIINCDGSIKKYYKKLTNIEFNMQTLYGEDEDILYHKFWQTPKCTCPKINNIEIYPSKNFIIDDKCPIHGKK